MGSGLSEGVVNMDICCFDKLIKGSCTKHILTGQQLV